MILDGTFKDKFLLLTFIILFSYSATAISAEGGPCKDYGECDEFKYSLNDFESLQRLSLIHISEPTRPY